MIDKVFKDCSTKVAKIPGTSNMLSIYSNHEYEINIGQHGFQFEQKVTDQKMTSCLSTNNFYHLHLTEIEGLKILHYAEIDAMSQDNHFVEIKSHDIENNSEEAFKVAFQMIHSGCSRLLYGIEYKYLRQCNENHKIECMCLASHEMQKKIESSTF